MPTPTDNGEHEAKSNALTIHETDDVDNPIISYVYSESLVVKTERQAVRKGRVDVVPESIKPRTISPISLVTAGVTYLISVFLPTGYPHSVSDDYLEYQIYDSVQAFSSSIAGLLASRAVLQGVGVGDATASPTSALLLHILQDSSGRIATILFAHRLGTAFEPECKMYRLAADVFNDLAMVLECLSPLVGMRVGRVAIISSAGVLRALCGVAASSSKASLSAHFAKWGNVAELNAKDSSQETIISLLGMLVGSFVVSHITGILTTWVTLLLLLSLHLRTNYMAVRAVRMTSLNRQRANIVLSSLLSSDPEFDLNRLKFCQDPGKRGAEREISTTLKQDRIKALYPEEVSTREKIFESDGILRWSSGLQSSSSSPQMLGFCRIGVSLQDLMILMRESQTSSAASASITLPVPSMLHHLITKTFSSEAYLLFHSFTSSSLITTSNRTVQVSIVLKKGCTPIQQLKAWTHALLVARILIPTTATNPNLIDPVTPAAQQQEALNSITCSLEFLNKQNRFETVYIPALLDAGWDLNTAALETTPKRRRVDISF